MRTIIGDCLSVLDTLPESAFDLIYLDPPFYTQKEHTLTTRDGSATFAFRDLWASHEEYARFLHERLSKLHRTLTYTGSLFFHCDSNAAHIVRLILDQVFGAAMFRSEIVWTYRRWSNANKGLLPAHQTILFYSKSADFKFNTLLTNYSASTNIDQITQRRVRDSRNKAVYARNEQGHVLSSGAKKGVPLSDVWDIPYLNPKAKERVGYPTQKPILLLEQIINLCTEAGDWVLDPFCGSGTTLIASKLLDRNAIGIDIAPEAITLTNSRLRDPVKTVSALLEQGRETYERKETDVFTYLKGLDYHIVQRNQGMDAILKQDIDGKPVFIRIQRPGEKLHEAAMALSDTSRTKGDAHLVLIVTEDNELPFGLEQPVGVTLVRSTALTIKDALCYALRSG
ncbi:MAG: site-specific DNA-methyltransferase [Armatimonadetes bacterium]|nr:site-specific DNA-methyltransferase [Armatimonadota bacterium]